MSAPTIEILITQLKNIGVEFHTDYKLLICIKCRICIYPSSISRHFCNSQRKVHLGDNAIPKETIDNITTIIKNLPPGSVLSGSELEEFTNAHIDPHTFKKKDGYKLHELNPIVNEINGIDYKFGDYCKVCGYCSFGLINRHLRDNHGIGQDDFPNWVMSKVAMQRLYVAGTNPKVTIYIPVKLSESSRLLQAGDNSGHTIPSIFDISHQQLEKFNNIEESYWKQAQSITKFPQFALTLNWHMIIGPFKIEYLNQLSSWYKDNHNKAKYSIIEKAVKQYMQSAQQELKYGRVNFGFRKQIVRMDDIGISKVWRPLQEDSTAAYYSETFAKLIATMIAEKDIKASDQEMYDDKSEFYSMVRYYRREGLYAYNDNVHSQRISRARNDLYSIINQQYDSQSSISQTVNCKIIECLQELNESMWMYETDKLDKSIYSPAYTYLALQSLNSTGTFESARVITKVAIQIKYFGYIALYNYARRERDRVESVDERNTIIERAQKYSNTDNNHPMYNLHMAYALLNKIKQNDGVNSKIHFPPNHDNYHTIRIDGKNVSLTQIGDYAKLLAQEAYDNLVGIVRNRELLDKVPPIHTIIDDCDNIDFGHSLLSHPEIKSLNTALHDDYMRQPIIGGIRFAMVTERPLSDDSQGPQYIIEWNDYHVNLFFQKCETFIKTLFVLVHIISGQPARAPEIERYTIRNTTDSRRLIYSLMDTMMVCSFYSKTENLTGDYKPIARFLPKGIAQLILQYLAIVRPFEQFLMSVHPQHNRETQKKYQRTYSTNLWVSRGLSLSADNLRKIFVDYNQEYLKMPLLFSTYRQSVQFFMNIHCRELMREDMVDEIDETINLQAGRTIVMGNEVYGHSSANKVPGIGANKLLRFYRLSNGWHKLLGIDNWKPHINIANITTRSSRAEYARINTSTNHYSETNNFDIIANYDNRRAPIITGNTDIRELVENITENITNNIIDGILVPITRMLTNNSQEPITVNTIARPTTIQNRFGVPDSTATPALSTTAKALDIVRHVYNMEGSSHNQFHHPNQGLGLSLALERQNDLCIISPTGSGKSAIFMVPPIIEKNKVTIIVVPLVSLTDDLLCRCENIGITDSKQWSSNINIYNPPRIIFAAVEHLGLEKFNTHINEWSSTNRLSRIVVDEAHLALTWDSFREHMGDLKWMRKKNFPIILLTATLPPTMEQRLFEAYNTHWPLVIRAPTTARKSIKYKIVNLDSQRNGNNTDRHAINDIKQKINSMDNDKDRAIVYISSKVKIAKIHEYFGQDVSTIYHADLDYDTRVNNYNCWKTDYRCRTIIATSAFSVGIDYDSVRYVFHLGIPHSLIDYSQETGRGGRSGQVSTAIMYSSSQSIQTAKAIAEKEANETSIQNIKQVEQFIRYSGCRREYLQQYLDGQAMNCIILGIELCDNCEKAYNDNRQQQQQQQQRELSPELDIELDDNILSTIGDMDIAIDENLKSTINYNTPTPSRLSKQNIILTPTRLFGQNNNNNSTSGRSPVFPRLSQQQCLSSPTTGASGKYIQHLHHESRELCNKLLNYLSKIDDHCPLCLLLSPSKEYKHPMNRLGDCPHLKRLLGRKGKPTCIKCLGDHLYSACMFRKELPRVCKNVCYACYIPNQILSQSNVVHPGTGTCKLYKYSESQRLIAYYIIRNMKPNETRTIREYVYRKLGDNHRIPDNIIIDEKRLIKYLFEPYDNGLLRVSMITLLTIQYLVDQNKALFNFLV